MSEAKELDGIYVEDAYVRVIVIKKLRCKESGNETIQRAIELLKKEG